MARLLCMEWLVVVLKKIPTLLSWKCRGKVGEPSAGAFPSRKAGDLAGMA